MRRTELMTSLLCLLLIGCGGDAAPAAARNEADDSAVAAPRPGSTAIPGQMPHGKPVMATLPSDVVAFRKRRGQCDHFRGEEPGDEGRAAELEKMLERACRGTDAELAGMRRRYRGDTAIVAALRDYDDQVE